MKSTFNVFYRRKREGKTDYLKRIRLLKMGKPRLVVRRSLKNVIVQLIEYNDKGDKVILSFHTNELKKFGWKGARRNLTSAYFVGLLAGINAKKKGFKGTFLDIGLYKAVKGSLVFAALKGALDGGLNIPHSEDIFSSEERLKGQHLKEKNNFDEIKNKILKS